MHDTEKQNFPKRKHPRLKEYDYSLNGYYFVTICSKNMRHIFGKIEPSSVGRGLAPAAQIAPERKVYLSQCGLIARQELLALESRYAFVRIDKFVIMPNHIHAIIVLDGETAGASPALRFQILFAPLNHLQLVRVMHLVSNKVQVFFKLRFMIKSSETKKAI